ncbi:hypothetical protein J7L65_05800 [Candidatus Bathyarchaeota archaeon]|nr:hypothetical protein [Candidatus Bathyarchaeota archaeon]
MPIPLGLRWSMSFRIISQWSYSSVSLGSASDLADKIDLSTTSHRAEV